jgi:hypothetical protein
VGKSKYFGTRVTNQNCIREEIKNKLNPGKGCYHSVQYLLSYRLLSKKLEIKIHKLGVKLGLKLMEKTNIENRVLKRIFGPKREKIGTGGWRKLQNEGLHNFHSSLNIIRVIKARSMRFSGHVECIGEIKMHAKLPMIHLNGRDHLMA